MLSIPVLVTVAVLAAAPALAQQTTAKGQEEPSSFPVADVAVVQGCYSSQGELVSIGILEFNAKGKCGPACLAKNKAVAASLGAECFCGDKYPPKKAIASDSSCNFPCPGYPYEACGSTNFFWTVYNTGLVMAVKDSDESVLSTSSTSSTTTSKPTSSSSTKAADTVYVSATNTAAPSQGNSGGGSTNVAGIAAGVVVGVIAIAGILGGIFFFMRRRRNRELEEKHRRSAAISTFFPRGNPPSSSGGYSVSDARLDPVMAANRRVSNGSIADNQDYSRKILRVTNA